MNKNLIRIAKELIEISGEPIEKAILGERQNISIFPHGDNITISFDDYEECFAHVSWDNFLDGVCACTHEHESMEIITKMKQVITEYEKRHGFTHDEWLKEQNQ